jgi:hypothetical protein
MEALCHALRTGRAPADLQAKLARLSLEHPMDLYLRRQSELLISLLAAPEAAEFCRLQPDDCRRLLRMLAYVRKDDDAIPDTWAGGFVDDHDLMRMTCAQLRPALDAYKAWHLSRRVARLWTAASCG